MSAWKNHIRAEAAVATAILILLTTGGACSEFALQHGMILAGVLVAFVAGALGMALLHLHGTYARLSYVRELANQKEQP